VYVCSELSQPFQRLRRPAACVHRGSALGAVLHRAEALVITQIFSERISVSLIMNCEIPWKSIESSAGPPGVRPPFLPPANWLNPARGGLFIAPAQPPPSFFLFFSGAGLARLSSRASAAPLKNKKNGSGSRFCYKQATPDGVFDPWRTLAVVRKHESQAVCINQFL
jgi:hypothetical protein